MSIVKRTRMMIRKDMLGKAITICFTDMNTKRNFCYPVDDFYEWLKSNTQCLKTDSWMNKGIYNWPYVPDKYFEFLDDWAFETIPEDTPVSEQRRFSDERIRDLKFFKQKYGHCYVYDIPDEVLVDEEEKRKFKGLKAWVNKKRKEYLNYVIADPYGAGAEENVDHIVDGPPMDEEEVAELTNIGFIFYEDLAYYFKTPNNDDRQHLIDILQELQSPETES